jgi:aryl-alcohol dehydrogenase-like predicted oxidoreductase
METRRMGRTGLKVSEICLGTMTFGFQCDEPTSIAIMDRAHDGGVDFFDTADVYPLGGGAERVGRTEEIVGRWLKGKRDRIVLATKAHGATGPGPNDRGGSRQHLVRAVEESLRRLQTDYIDLYQLHGYDSETPLDETLRALDDMVRSGKVRYIGCSNYRAWQLATALWTSDRLGTARFDCDQPRYNILYRDIELDLLPLCRAQGVGVIAYNPLAGGFLTGKYAKGEQPREGTRFTLGTAGRMYQARYWREAQFDAVEGLKRYFSERDKSLTQVAVAWVLNRPGITAAIVGASRPDQLTDTLAATELHLEASEEEVLDEVWYNLPREQDPAIALR